MMPPLNSAGQQPRESRPGLVALPQSILLAIMMLFIGTGRGREPEVEPAIAV
jgi:hypothetical protein